MEKLICPYCERESQYKTNYRWTWGDQTEEVQCPKCHKTFEVYMMPRDRDNPDYCSVDPIPYKRD